MTDLIIHQGDMFDLRSEAVVNAANKELQPGGGVCGLIYRKAGPGLTAWSEDIVKRGQIYAGGAIVSPSFDLDQQFGCIIHAVAPNLRQIMAHSHPNLMASVGMALLISAYQSIFSIAEALKLSGVVMPSLGTGIYGWPHDTAADCLKVALNHPWDGEAVLAIYNPDDVPHYERLVR